MTRTRIHTDMTRRGVILSGTSAIAAALAMPALGDERAVVLGGGPAGVSMALALARSGRAGQVTLLERDPTRLGPTGSDMPRALIRARSDVSLDALLTAGVAVVLDAAVEVDWTAGRVALFSGREMAFGHLYLAPGTTARDEGIAGLNSSAQHLWPAAWGSAVEARRLAARLSALPEGGHVVLRLPAELSHPEVVTARAAWLSDAVRDRGARLSVIQATQDPKARDALPDQLRESLTWHLAGEGGRVFSVDAERGLIETDAGLLHADVVNFVPLQGAGTIADRAGLTDGSGWCPVDGAGRSTLCAQASVLGDARLGARRTRGAASVADPTKHT